MSVATRNAPAAHRGTILLAEDEDAVRQFVVLVLEQAGYTVHPAADGDHALALFRTDPGRFDLVLSDVLMPNRTGPELAAEVRRIRPDTQLLFMSGFTGGPPVRPAGIPSEVTVLPKPFPIDHLLAAVAAAVGGE